MNLGVFKQRKSIRNLVLCLEIPWDWNYRTWGRPDAKQTATRNYCPEKELKITKESEIGIWIGGGYISGTAIQIRNTTLNVLN